MRERDLLENIFARNATLPGRITIPPGDDMGAVRINGQDVLVTVDQVIDTIHFNIAHNTMRAIGRKAITRNLSDVAAMAAQPLGAVAAACLPANFSSADADDLVDAMRETGLVYDCPLFGGDVAVGGGRLIITVTVLAHASEYPPVLRRGAQPGDAIYVTGELGGSYERPEDDAHHMAFEPRLSLAQSLVQGFEVHAMIDVSDGLARDVGHICRASEVHGRLREDLLPLRDDARGRAARLGCPAWQCALADGEDYELCFTAPSSTSLPAQLEGVQITRVGECVPTDDGPTVILQTTDGDARGVDHLGWEHHAQ